jgi:type I restriction enzyme M protein
MRAPKDGGSRTGIVFNGSPLFTGDAGSGESNIRQWIIENEGLDAVVALPDQLVYNTGLTSNKKNDKARIEEIEAGKGRQEQIRNLLADFAKGHGETLYTDRRKFLTDLREADRAAGVRLSAPEIKAVLGALGERDETAEICRDRDGNPEPDTDLRDTESVPLEEGIAEYFKREVLPHVPDAWIDESKTRIGHEIPLNRHFYRYEPPRPLEEIEADIKAIQKDIVRMLAEVTA